jgi:predicted  nucleic acid-binding Zn-ribbon protein
MQAFKAVHDATVRRLEELVASLHANFSVRLDEGLAASAMAAADLARQLEDVRRDAAQTAASLEEQLAAGRAERAALSEQLEQKSVELEALRRDMATAAASVATTPNLNTPPASSLTTTKADLSAMSSRLEAVKSDIFTLSSSLDETNAALELVRAEMSASRSKQGVGTESAWWEERIKSLGVGLEQTNAELASLRRDLAGPFLDDEDW